MYVNELMQLQAGEDYDEKAINNLVSNWASLRLNACMLNPDFVKKVKGTENGAIYLKTLRE